jgi:hypothetical protein
VLTRPDPDRASLIGRLAQRDEMSALADSMIELENDELAWLQVIAALEQRFSLPPETRARLATAYCLLSPVSALSRPARSRPALG